MKLLILITILACSFVCQAQGESTKVDTLQKGSTSFKAGPALPPYWDGAPKHGYHPTGEFDTVSVLLLVTLCENCQSRSVKALAVRERYTYYGDRMDFPLSDGNRDSWRITKFLSLRKIPFPETTHIWDHKFLNQTIQ